MNARLWFVVVLLLLLSSTPAFAAPPQYLFSWGSWGLDGPGGTFAYPRYAAFNPSGILYVTDAENHRIQKFTVQGVFLGFINRPNLMLFAWWNPSGIAFDSHGNFYVVGTGNTTVAKFSPAGALIRYWGSEGNANGQFLYPYPVAVDAEDLVYIGDKDNDRIQVFDSDGNYLRGWNGTTSGSGRFRPVDLKFAPDGTLLVADAPNGRIVRFTPNGAYLGQIGTMGTGPGQLSGGSGLAVDAAGNIYIADGFNDRIQMFGPTGNWILAWGTTGTGPGQFDRPLGLTLSPTGDRLYVVDNENYRIQVFSIEAPVPVQSTTWGSLKQQFVR